MVTKGFRARGTAVRWAMLVVAGAPELAALSLPRAALARALDRRPYRVAKGEPEPVE